MKFFYLLSNGEITKGEAPSMEEIPQRHEGFDVISAVEASYGRGALEKVKKAVFPDEELLAAG